MVDDTFQKVTVSCYELLDMCMIRQSESHPALKTI